MNAKEISVLVVVWLILGLLLFIPIQPTKAQFVISSWVYPADEYGQGIKLFHFYDNSSGSWVEFSDIVGYDSDNGSVVECPAGVGIKIRCNTYLNSTFFGLGDETEGFDYFQHNITVAASGETIFSQQNFTMFNYGHIGAMYSYNYEVILGFIPIQGTIYTITIIYEVYYE